MDQKSNVLTVLHRSESRNAQYLLAKFDYVSVEILMRLI